MHLYASLLFVFNFFVTKLFFLRLINVQKEVNRSELRKTISFILSAGVFLHNDNC